MTSLSKITHRDAGDKLVHVMIEADAEAQDAAFVPFTFSSSVIEGVARRGDAATLTLLSGRKIPVAMSFDALCEKIYRSDFREPDIDLRTVTGLAAAPADIVIRAPLRITLDGLVMEFTFKEKEIVTFSPHQRGMFSKTGEAVTLQFNEAAQTRFKRKSDLVLDMPYRDYQKFLAEARATGKSTLDLCAIFAKNPQRYGFKGK